ncbi:Rv3654c family TadE-like protein [Streptomyces flavovirens]|uniref:Rv3654c family TadE-like protein n=1 Tax=Streptomyces flavovirens TaxID=52258 RepID=UPI003D11D874
MRAGPRQSRAAATDRGMATVWVAVTTATLCAVFAVVLALGQAVAARHEAGAAADLAALAAADRALLGAAEACEAAREVTGAQGAELVRCVVRGDIADVTARAHFGPYAPEARSRAGPPMAQTPGVPAVPARMAGTGTGTGTTPGVDGELELPVTVP